MIQAGAGTVAAIVIVAIIVLIAIVVAIAGARRQRARMQEHYGEEYERTLRAAGSRSAAESELRSREKRRKRLDIRPLPGGLREGYAAQWKTIQARFVDEPRKALDDADRLLHQVMEARGYPMADLNSQANDLSVDYGPLVTDYRRASTIARTSREGGASTEDQRQAMVLFRSMFDALLDPGTGEASSASRFEPSERTSA